MSKEIKVLTKKIEVLAEILSKVINNDLIDKKFKDIDEAAAKKDGRSEAWSEERRAKISERNKMAWAEKRQVKQKLTLEEKKKLALEKAEKKAKEKAAWDATYTISKYQYVDERPTVIYGAKAIAVSSGYSEAWVYRTLESLETDGFVNTERDARGVKRKVIYARNDDAMERLRHKEANETGDINLVIHLPSKHSKAF